MKGLTGLQGLPGCDGVKVSDFILILSIFQLKYNLNQNY